jgi:hypothetical protein
VPGEIALTPNGFHTLCFQCPEARELMGDICAGLVERFGCDGAKYDLFNATPPGPCASREHEHDTTSPIEGLTRALALIDARTRALKSDHIIELKQNYATPYLHGYGTCVRAGDTPYNPEGNFLRAAYVQAYTPWAMNDYQTVTAADTPAEAACLILKMLAVGIPAYSMDLPSLPETHKRVLAFWHDWYARRLAILRRGRTPLDGRLAAWVARGESSNVYFLLNAESRLELPEAGDCEIVCGTFCPRLHLHFPRPVSFDVTADQPDRPGYRSEHRSGVQDAVISAQPGDILTLRLGK